MFEANVLGLEGFSMDAGGELRHAQRSAERAGSFKSSFQRFVDSGKILGANGKGARERFLLECGIGANNRVGGLDDEIFDGDLVGAP